MALVNFKTFINNLYNILHNEILLKQDILIAGDNITITDGKNISAKDTTYSEATTSKAGLLSVSDKTKLNGVASGAQVNVQSDWNATSGDSFIKNKPSIPSAAANGTLTITQGGTTKGTFSANQSSNVTIDIDASSSASINFDYVNATTSLDTITSAGVYAVKAASTTYKRPANYSGIMIVNVNGTTITQYYYYGYNAKSAATTIYIYKRTKTGSGSWSSWANQ